MYYMLRVSYTASCYRLFGSWGPRSGGARDVNFTCMTVPIHLVKDLFIRRERDVHLLRVGHLVALTSDL